MRRRGRSAPTARPLAALAAAGTLLAAAPGVSAPAAAAPVGAARDAAASHTPVTYGAWAAGYLATAPAGHRFTAVSSRFVLPTTGPQPTPPAGAAAWVSIWTGIGIEARTGDLMQAGVSLLASPGGGWQLAAPWWINEPATPTEPHPLDLAVSPGDEIAVDVREVDPADPIWVFTVRDVTRGVRATGWCYDCTSDGRTAAWVEEDPLNGRSPTPFADPGRVRFETASATLDGGVLTPLDQQAWQPLIRTLVPLTAHVGAGAKVSAGGSAQGPPAAPAAGGAFTIGELGAAGPLAGGSAASATGAAAATS